MAWIYLVIAGLMEIIWAVGLKYSEGFTKLWISIGTAIVMIASFYFLSQAMKSIPLGTAYAVWTGIGAVGTAIVGMILFQESKDILRLLCMVLIIAGVLGLKFLAKG